MSFFYIFDWAAESGFEIDRNQSIFGGGRKDYFLAEFDKEFVNWGKEKGGKV